MGKASSGHLLTVLPHVFQDHGGVIVNITATLGSRGQVLQVHAGSAKAAVGTGTPSGLPAWAPVGSLSGLSLEAHGVLVKLSTVVGSGEGRPWP